MPPLKTRNVLSIQSHVAYGHVGNSAATFALQRLGVEVWPVHTVQYSNHKGYGGWTGVEFPPAHVSELIDGLAARGVLARCDAVLSGYSGSAEMGAAIIESLGRVRRANPAALYLCDPVMGDDAGGLYVAEDLPAFFRARAVPLADIVTPNRSELEVLSGRRVQSLEDALDAARGIIALGPSIVLVTSLRHATTQSDEIEMLAVRADTAWRLRTPLLHLDPIPNGAGDTLAALFLAHYLKERACAGALASSAAAIHGVLAATQAVGTRELRLIGAQEELVRPSHRFTAERIG